MPAYYGFLSLLPLLLVFATLLANALAHNPQLQREIIEAALALTEELRPEETVEVHFSPEADDHRPAR